MNTARDILEKKGRAIWSVRPEAPVYEAIESMADHGAGALLVMDGDRLLGIVSERDYARKVILEGRSSKDTPVSAIMTSRVVYGTLDTTIEQCMAVMTEQRIRHLPILDAGRVAGVLSIGDLVKAIITEQKFVIEELVRYVNDCPSWRPDATA